jgi:hypothetical protein
MIKKRDIERTSEGLDHVATTHQRYFDKTNASAASAVRELRQDSMDFVRGSDRMKECAGDAAAVSASLLRCAAFAAGNLGERLILTG